MNGSGASLICEMTSRCKGMNDFSEQSVRTLHLLTFTDLRTPLFSHCESELTLGWPWTVSGSVCYSCVHSSTHMCWTFVLRERNISAKNENLLKMCSPSGNQDVDEFVSSSDLEKCSIASLAQQWMLCSEWVPSEWESKQLIKTSQFYNTTFLQIWWRNKLIYILNGLRVSTFSAHFNVWLNYSFKAAVLISLPVQTLVNVVLQYCLVHYCFKSFPLLSLSLSFSQRRRGFVWRDRRRRGPAHSRAQRGRVCPRQGRQTCWTALSWPRFQLNRCGREKRPVPAERPQRSAFPETEGNPWTHKNMSRSYFTLKSKEKNVYNERRLFSCIAYPKFSLQ